VVVPDVPAYPFRWIWLLPAAYTPYAFTVVRRLVIRATLHARGLRVHPSLPLPPQFVGVPHVPPGALVILTCLRWWVGPLDLVPLLPRLPHVLTRWAFGILPPILPRCVLRYTPYILRFTTVDVLPFGATLRRYVRCVAYITTRFTPLPVVERLLPRTAYTDAVGVALLPLLQLQRPTHIAPTASCRRAARTCACRLFLPRWWLFSFDGYPGFPHHISTVPIDVWAQFLAVPAWVYVAVGPTIYRVGVTPLPGCAFLPTPCLALRLLQCDCSFYHLHHTLACLPYVSLPVVAFRPFHLVHALPIPLPLPLFIPFVVLLPFLR